jgi:hypothetical protein
MFVIFWHAWRGIGQDFAVFVIKGCHVGGLLKQHLGYHKTSDCWYFILLVCFAYCNVLILTVRTDGRWKTSAIYCNTIRCHHCRMML